MFVSHDLLVLVIILAALFWIFCILQIVFCGNPYINALPQSSLDMMKAWTNVLQASGVRYFLIRPMLYKYIEHVRLTVLMWSFIVNDWSYVTPRLRTFFLIGTSWSPTFMVTNSNFSISLILPNMINSVLSSFNLRKFDLNHLRLSSIQASNFFKDHVQ